MKGNPMTEKKFDIIGIGHPCIDYLLHIDSLPGPNESRYARQGSWQCGGKVTTGLVAAARCGLSCALIGAMGDDLFGRYCYRDFAIHGIDLSHAYLREGKTTDIGVVLSEDETHGRNILYRRGNYERIRQDEIDFSFLEQGRYLFIALVDELHMAAAKYAKKHGVKVLIDADSRPMDYYEEILPYVDYFVASEFVIINREKVVGVHYLHKVSRPDGAHLALLVVEVVDALVDAGAAALDGLHVHRVVL